MEEIKRGGWGRPLKRQGRGVWGRPLWKGRKGEESGCILHCNTRLQSVSKEDRGEREERKKRRNLPSDLEAIKVSVCVCVCVCLCVCVCVCVHLAHAVHVYT